MPISVVGGGGKGQQLGDPGFQKGGTLMTDLF